MKTSAFEFLRIDGSKMWPSLFSIDLNLHYLLQEDIYVVWNFCFQILSFSTAWIFNCSDHDFRLSHSVIFDNALKQAIDWIILWTVYAGSTHAHAAMVRPSFVVIYGPVCIIFLYDYEAGDENSFKTKALKHSALPLIFSCGHATL